jgi:phage baseplate assembly protein V
MSQFKGVITGQVVNVTDPDGQGRVQVSFPFLGGENQSYWAPVASLMAGRGRGSWWMPEVGDEALVAFNQNDPAHPHILGYHHNGEDQPPESDPQLRVIRSVNGHEIRLYDPAPSQGDMGYVQIKDAHGNMIELANARISITSVAVIEINAPQVIINGRPVAPAAGPI